MKRKISKAEYEALSAELQALYKVSGENYILELEDDGDDVGELRRAHARTKQEANELKEKLAALEAEKRKREEEEQNLDAEAARKRGDVVRLEELWRNEREQLVGEHEQKYTKLTGEFTKILVTDKAELIAKELFGDNWLIGLPHVKQRLAADFTGETPVTKVLTQSGDPSTLSLEELKKEFLNNKAFGSIIKGVESSGGGATHQGKGGADGQKKPSEYTEQERIELYRNNPAKFNELFQSH